MVKVFRSRQGMARVSTTLAQKPHTGGRQGRHAKGSIMIPKGRAVTTREVRLSLVPPVRVLVNAWTGRPHPPEHPLFLTTMKSTSKL